MADVHDGLARYLADAGLLDYRPDTAGGDAYLDDMPPTPGEAVGLFLYDGGGQDATLAVDQVRVQVRVRGASSPAVSRTRAWAIYAALTGLSDTILPEGTHLILCAANGTPAPMGRDSSGRMEHVVNFVCDVAAPTEHRS